MVYRYQGHVIHAVWKAARRGETLQVCQAAQSIAAAIGCPHLLDTIVDALVQENIRQKASYEMNQPRTPRPS